MLNKPSFTVRKNEVNLRRRANFSRQECHKTTTEQLDKLRSAIMETKYSLPAALTNASTTESISEERHSIGRSSGLGEMRCETLNSKIFNIDIENLFSLEPNSTFWPYVRLYRDIFWKYSISDSKKNSCLCRSSTFQVHYDRISKGTQNSCNGITALPMGSHVPILHGLRSMDSLIEVLSSCITRVPYMAYVL